MLKLLPRLLGLALAFVFAALISLRAPSRGEVLDVVFTMTSPELSEPRQLSVPFRFDQQGLSSDARVTLTSSLQLEGSLDSPALLIERPLFEAEVLWDGRPLGPQQPPRADRFQGGQALLLLLPEGEAAGQHELTLVLQGAYGEGGLLQQIRVGEAEAFIEGLTQESLLTLAVIAVLLFASSMNLLIAASRPERELPLSMGLFFLALAGVAFTNVDAWYLRFDSHLWRLKMKAVSITLAVGFCPMVLSCFTALSMRHARRVALFATALGLSAGLVPGYVYFQWVRSAVYLASGGMALLAVVFVVDALRRSRRDTHIFAVLAVLMIVAGMVDLGVEFAQLDIPPNVPLAAGIWAVCITALVTLRSTDLADRYRRWLSRAQDAIFVLDRSGETLDLNEAGRRLLSQAGQDSLAASVPASHRGDIESYLRGSDPTQRKEFPVLQDGRLRFMESVGVELEAQQRLLILRDISARRELERGLLVAARMETLGMLAGGIAHDFNNTMTTLMGQITLIRSAPDESKLDARLEKMDTILSAASQMVRRLTTLSQGSASTRHPQDLNLLLRSFTPFAQKMLPGGLLIELSLHPEPLIVELASAELEQALLNLILNARDATPSSGGRIFIETSLRPEDGLILLAVEDQGPGVEPELQDRIFEPFYSTKEEGHGSGIGLAVCSRIVLEHGGRIGLVPGQHGSGARFELEFPAGDALPVRTPFDPEEEGSPRRQRVLIVEDNEAIREYMELTLKQRGFTTRSAASAEEARRTVDAEGFDLLLTDVVMDGEDGISLAQDLFRRRPELKVLVVSGYIPDHLRQMHFSWGALSKPFTGEQLVTAVRHCLLADEVS